MEKLLFHYGYGAPRHAVEIEVGERFDASMSTAAKEFTERLASMAQRLQAQSSDPQVEVSIPPFHEPEAHRGGVHAWSLLHERNVRREIELDERSNLVLHLEVADRFHRGNDAV